ncbi:hypothetical protein SBA7_350010 [Candidatus Sulfotelmatobacter sp. SbA7]|nr:hypothetical protein SBA7_350010 [Candidatus Sulfotelmatobacter sp. SbA7]
MVLILGGAAVHRCGKGMVGIAALQAAEKIITSARSIPRALKRGHIFQRLTARVNSCPSQNLLELEFFRSL